MGRKFRAELMLLRARLMMCEGTGVKEVEVSTDGGQTWNLAAGDTGWSYTWTLPEAGTYSIKSRATDRAGNVETPGEGVTVTVETGEPIAVTNPASNVTLTSATLNGAVNPKDSETTVVFEWGETDLYGNEISATQSPLNGSVSLDVSADLAALSAERVYHYRVKAANSKGMAMGRPSFRHGP